MSLFNSNSTNNIEKVSEQPDVLLRKLSSLIKEYDNLIISNIPVNVTISNSKLSFNFLSDLPSGAKLIDYNISIYSVSDSGTSELLKAGLSISTSNYLLKKSSDIYLMKGNIEFKNKSGTLLTTVFSFNVTSGVNTINLMFTKILPVITNYEGLFKYILENINSLNLRISQVE